MNIENVNLNQNFKEDNFVIIDRSQDEVFIDIENK